MSLCMPLSHETHEVPQICPILASLDHSSKVRMAAAIGIKLSSTAKSALNEKSRRIWLPSNVWFEPMLSCISLQAHVVAAAASADTSSWALPGGNSQRAGTHQCTLQAGQTVSLEVDLRDAYGNLAGGCCLAATWILTYKAY